MSGKRILFVGDASHHEFSEAVAWLLEYSDLTIVSDCDDACEFLSRQNVIPETIVVAASRPGQFTQRQIESLIQRSPLVPIVALMGGWCEGEMRTGNPWRGVIRVYWHQFVPRMAEELVSINRRGRLSLPRTFTEVEVHNANIAIPDVKPRGMVVIRAATLDVYESLADTCSVIGHATVWENARQAAFVRGAVAALWDVGSSIEFDQCALRDFTSRVAPAPTMVVAGFPRPSDRELAIDCGASAIVSKPFLQQEIWCELARVTASCLTEVEATSVA